MHRQRVLPHRGADPAWDKAAKDAEAAEKASWNMHMPGPMDFRSPPFS
ncbi:hypothetical protein GCM10023205_27380 [Yinghuangia aomiensis]|uniref:Uncharacterized protein n=1 Tax=Yinghuangia aomiensis TaxID=676205 RepID=A0ABP9H6I7_9ACTN